MKVLGSRFSFYVGFVVGTVTLYVFLSFEKSFFPQRVSSLDKLRQQLEEDEKVWKKDRSALFNLKHPHHTGASHSCPRKWVQVHLQGGFGSCLSFLSTANILLSFYVESRSQHTGCCTNPCLHNQTHNEPVSAHLWWISER